jgi:NTE family protein
VRTCQQEELARTNLARLEHEADVMMIEPVPYAKVRGAGFYRQFLNTKEWPDFMRAGRLETRRVLAAGAGSTSPAGGPYRPASRPRKRSISTP